MKLRPVPKREILSCGVRHGDPGSPRFVAPRLWMPIACVLFCAWNAMATGPTVRPSPWSPFMKETTNTLVQSQPGTDSLVLEMPFQVWRWTKTPIVSNIIELESVMFDTGLGQESKTIVVGIRFRKESLKKPIEYKVSFLDAQGRVVADSQSTVTPAYYAEGRSRAIRFAPLFGASFLVFLDHARTVKWKEEGRDYSARLPTNWETCRIEFRALTPERKVGNATN